MGFGKAQHSPPAPISSQLLFCFVFWLHMGYVYCTEPIEPIEPMGCYTTRHHGSWQGAPQQNFLVKRWGEIETVTCKTHPRVKARRNWPGRPAGRERTNGTKQLTRDP